MSDTHIHQLEAELAAKDKEIANLTSEVVARGQVLQEWFQAAERAFKEIDVIVGPAHAAEIERKQRNGGG
jgi:hypothetical protein